MIIVSTALRGEEARYLEVRTKSLEDAKDAHEITIAAHEVEIASLRAELNALKLTTASYMDVRSRYFAAFLRDKILTSITRLNITRMPSSSFFQS